MAWLMKSEPNVYSIWDLERDGWTPWEGVRNYQARNLMRDEMKLADPVLFYHSNATPPGIAGLAKISRLAYPDDTAWNAQSPYFDPKASPDNPRWLRVDLTFVEAFPTLISLATLKAHPILKEMLVCRRGMRLSVQPVAPEHFDLVRAIATETSAQY